MNFAWDTLPLVCWDCGRPMSPRFFKTVFKLGSPPFLEVLKTRKIAWTLSPYGARKSAVFNSSFNLRSWCYATTIAVGQHGCEQSDVRRLPSACWAVASFQSDARHRRMTKASPGIQDSAGDGRIDGWIGTGGCPSAATPDLEHRWRKSADRAFLLVAWPNTCVNGSDDGGDRFLSCSSLIMAWRS